MDKAAYNRFLLVRKKRSLATAKALLTGIQRLERLGFNVDRFKQDSETESETYLSKRLEKGATVFTYNNDVYVIRSLAEFLNLKVNAKPQPQPKTAPRVLTPMQLSLLMAYKDTGSRETNRLRRAIIHLMRYTGLRPSESVRLTTNDMHPATSTVSIRLSSKRGITGDIPVPRSLWRPRSPLMAYLRQRPTNHGDWLWVTKRTGRLNQEAYEKHLAAVQDALGFRVTHTALRHTIATELHREEGMDAVFIRLFLRHKSITSSLHYVETNHDDLIRKYHQKRK